jgi:hypothetical protein
MTVMEQVLVRQAEQGLFMAANGQFFAIKAALFSAFPPIPLPLPPSSENGLTGR